MPRYHGKPTMQNIPSNGTVKKKKKTWSAQRHNRLLASQQKDRDTFFSIVVQYAPSLWPAASDLWHAKFVGFLDEARLQLSRAPCQTILFSGFLFFDPKRYGRTFVGSRSCPENEARWHAAHVCRHHTPSETPKLGTQQLREMEHELSYPSYEIWADQVSSEASKQPIVSIQTVSPTKIVFQTKIPLWFRPVPS